MEGSLREGGITKEKSDVIKEDIGGVRRPMQLGGVTDKRVSRVWRTMVEEGLQHFEGRGEGG